MLPKFASCFATPGIGHLRATMGHLKLSIGYLKATVVHIELGHLKVTIGNFLLSANIRQTQLSFTPK